MQCPVCHNDFQQLDSHHIYPTGFGGPQDGPRYDLCSGCHQAIHSQAKAATSKSKNRKNYLAPDALQRAAGLISAIIRAEQNYKAGIVPEGFEANIHQVSFWTDQQNLRLLHSAKKLLGFRSLDDMLNAMAKSIIIKAHGGGSADMLKEVNPYMKGVLSPKNRVIRALPSPSEAPDAVVHKGQKDPETG